MPYLSRPKCSRCQCSVQLFYDVVDPKAAVYPSVRSTLAPLLSKDENSNRTSSAKGNDSDRPTTVVLSHGFGSGSELWKDQVPALVQAGFRVVSWDMCGHAKSSSPESECCYSKQHQIDDLSRVMEATGCHASGQKPILCGHSMGGYDTMLYYFAHPEKVAAMVLYGTGPGFASDKSRLKWNATAEKMAAAYDRKGLGALRGSDTRKGHRSAVGLALSCRRVFAQHEDDPLYKSFGKDGPLTTARNLNTVAVPVSIIIGERDKGFLRASKIMHERMPNATLSILTGVGHLACEKDPQQFNKVRTHQLVSF